MAPTNTTVGPRPEEIIDSLTTLVSKAEGELVLVTCVDQEGYAGDTEAYASTDQPKSSLPLELLFSLPQSQEIDAVMVTSRAASSLEDVADSDIVFTKDLIDAARAQGIEVLDHVLVLDGKYKRLRAVTELWN
jgi:DNA repair protein RadC